MVSPYWVMAHHLKMVNRELTRLFLDQDSIDYRILVIEAPPRHGKSELISKHLPAWYLTHHPNHRVILCSYEANYAMSWGRKVRDLHRGIGSLFDIVIREDVKASYEWEIDKYGGGMTCAGVGGPITGKGANLFVIDDYFKNAEQAISPVIREKLWEWWNSTAYTRLEPGAIVVVVATRWHEDGLIGRLGSEFEGEKIRVVKLPAISLGPEIDYLGREKGKPLWPDRYDDKALERIRLSLDTYWWNALYQQDPTGYGAAEWPSEYFGSHLFYQARPLAFEHRVMAVDASLGRSEDSDYSAGICSCLTGGKLFIDGFVERLPAEALADRIIDIYLEKDLEAIGIEKNAFQELLGPIIQLKARQRGLGPLPIKLINNTINKEIRIRRLGPFLHSQLLKLDPKLVLLLKQLKEFPNSEYDDGPDALEMAIRLIRWLTKKRFFADTPIEGL